MGANMQRCALAAAVTALAALSGPMAAAETLKFPDVALEGVTFSGLLLDGGASASGDTPYTLMCVATPTEADVSKKLQVTIFVLNKNDAILGQVAFGGSDWVTQPGYSIRCDQPVSTRNRTDKPVKLKIQVRATEAISRAILKPSATAPGTFEPVVRNGITFSNLSAQIIPAADRSIYVFGCAATAGKGEIRNVKDVAFFMWAKGASVPYAWRQHTGGDLNLRNGDTKDCGANSGPLPSYGLDAGGMSIQVLEQLPDRHRFMIVDALKP